MSDSLTPADIERWWTLAECGFASLTVWYGDSREPPTTMPEALRRFLLTSAREHGRQNGACPYTVVELRGAWEEGASASVVAAGMAVFHHEHAKQRRDPDADAALDAALEEAFANVAPEPKT